MLIVCAGMFRSASTWVFNAAKIIAKKKYRGMPVTHGLGTVENPKGSIHVAKTHEFDSWLAARADLILTSHRDLRDVVASFRRMGEDPGVPKTVYTDPSLFCLAVYHWYTAWRDDRKCRFDLCYYTFAENGRDFYTRMLCDVLDYCPPSIPDLRDEIEATRKLKGLTTEMHHPETFYHAKHFTNGKAGAWHGELSDADLKAIRSSGVPLTCFEEMKRHG